MSKNTRQHAFQVKLHTLDNQNPPWRTVDRDWFYKLARRLNIGEATMARAFERGEMVGAFAEGASYYLRRIPR